MQTINSGPPGERTPQALWSRYRELVSLWRASEKALSALRADVVSREFDAQAYEQAFDSWVRSVLLGLSATAKMGNTPEGCSWLRTGLSSLGSGPRKDGFWRVTLRASPPEIAIAESREDQAVEDLRVWLSQLGPEEIRGMSESRDRGNCLKMDLGGLGLPAGPRDVVDHGDPED